MPSRSNVVKDPVRYKTVACQNWAARGECPYGSKCQFAHGAEDLRERLTKRDPEKPRKELQNKGAGACNSFDRIDGRGKKKMPMPIESVEMPVQAATNVPLMPEQPAAVAALPPGLSTRRAVTWASRDVVVANSPSGPPPSPSTPPHAAQRPHGSPLAEHEVPPLCGSCCEPTLCRDDSGLQPRVSINSVTGKIELTGRITVSRQPSYNTASVRRQLSLLFDDELDERELPPTSSSIWQHDHFGLPAAAA